MTTSLGERIRAILIWLRPSGDEDESRRDGPFSTVKEVHAFVIGVYAGFTDAPEWPGFDHCLNRRPDLDAERHYGEAGYVLGAVLRWRVDPTVTRR